MRQELKWETEAQTRKKSEKAGEGIRQGLPKTKEPFEELYGNNTIEASYNLLYIYIYIYI